MSQLEGMLTGEPLPPSRNRRSPVRRIVAVLAVLALVGLAWSGARLLSGSQDPGFTGPGTGSVTVVIERGMSLRAMGEALAAAGVVASADAFVDAAGANDAAGGIGPGTYALREGMAADLAVTLLLDPSSRVTDKLVLPEGLRLKQSIATAAEATGLPKADFQSALEAPGELGLPAWAGGKPEGFLFPATYEIPEGADAADVLRTLIARFGKASADIGLEARAAKAGMSPYDVLITASLIEAEVKPRDFAKVSAVIRNRLAAGMPLQLDAAVAYGLGVKDLQLSQEQLDEDTPYNTYLRKGLPPTPINSPGEAAIEAALAPADGAWLYYVTVDPATGKTRFTKSYDTFLELKAQLKRNLASQGSSG